MRGLATLRATNVVHGGHESYHSRCSGVGCYAAGIYVHLDPQTEHAGSQLSSACRIGSRFLSIARRTIVENTYMVAAHAPHLPPLPDRPEQINEVWEAAARESFSTCGRGSSTRTVRSADSRARDIVA